MCKRLGGDEDEDEKYKVKDVGVVEMEMMD